MNNGEVVSLIMNRFRSLTMDKKISRGYVLSEFNTASLFLLKQKINEGSISTNSLYKEFNCVEMEKVSSIKCPVLELRSCKTLMRSVEKVPEPLVTRFGAMIREVTTIDSERVFKQMTPSKYRRESLKPSDPRDSKLYFLYSEGHIYIPDTEVYMINLQEITFDHERIEEMRGCQEDENMCKSIWEYEVNIPEELIRGAVDMVSQSMGITKSIQIPEKQDQNETT